MKKITELDELERLMKGRTAALKEVEPLVGDTKFTFITSRYSPNMSVEPTIAKKFLEKNLVNLKVIALNEGSTTLHVLTK